MPFTKGMTKVGGRTTGTPNKTKSGVDEAIAASKGGTPAEILVKAMHHKKTKPDVVRRIAEILLAYTEGKPPTRIEQTNMNEYQELSEDELLQRLKELE